MAMDPAGRSAHFFRPGMSKTGFAGLGVLGVAIFCANVLPARDSISALVPLLVCADFLRRRLLPLNTPNGRTSGNWLLLGYPRHRAPGCFALGKFNNASAQNHRHHPARHDRAATLAPTPNRRPHRRACRTRGGSWPSPASPQLRHHDRQRRPARSWSCTSSPSASPKPRPRRFRRLVFLSRQPLQNPAPASTSA